MDAVPLKGFQRAVKEAAESFCAGACRDVSLVHHNDTDGISAGAILRKSLTRQGFAVENLPVERVHPAFLPAIHGPGRRLIVYADLGGQSAAAISAHIRADSQVLIIDHHLPEVCGEPRLVQINPERFGIDGDKACAAATAAWFFSLALSEKNRDLAPLAVLGAMGDHQMAGGRCEGLNALALETALGQGALQPCHVDAEAPYLFRPFPGRTLREADELILSLAVNGYYRRGADLALAACLDGPDDRLAAFCAETAGIRQDRFGRELSRIGGSGMGRAGHIVWTDVEDRFYPLGLKAIGLFCEALIAGGVVGGDDYVLGFQRFPGENPYLGRFPGQEKKVSFRVTPGLRRRIEAGERSDLMQLVPGAIRRVGGFADACHRYAAAGTIPEHRTGDLVRLLSEAAG